MVPEKCSGAEWITISEAVKRLPVRVSKSAVRRWIEEGKYGIVAGRFAGRVVIRSDTLPEILEEPFG
ncbi:MAG: helix-turn-helix domain-containing protein [Candidatus Glassbacteria bacterium]|nr:helix-turn-helix domain-containing protein [Candidatus Glassbacteria bacterium]